MKVINKNTLIQMETESDILEKLEENNFFLTQDAKEYIKSKTLNIGKNPKPEHLTHLNGKELVIKSHKCIALRGKLDSFQAKILEVQLEAKNAGNFTLLGELNEILDFSRRILMCEVTGEDFGEINLFGYDQEQLRAVSQNPFKYFGVNHMAPTVEMGKMCILLNSLRTDAREVELSGISAFCDDSTVKKREDILQALNRLSSGLYILFCKCLADKKEVL